MQTRLRKQRENIMSKKDEAILAIAAALRGTPQQCDEAALMIDSYARSARDLFIGYANKLNILHTAASKGHLGIVRALIRAGVSLVKKNETGSTPLLLASLREQWEAADVIEDAIKETRSDDHYLLLVTCIKEGRTSSALTLLEQKTISKKASYFLYKSKRTPLHYAAAYDNHTVLEALLAYGAPPIETDSSGQLPFITAVLNQHWKAAVMLAKATNAWLLHLEKSVHSDKASGDQAKMEQAHQSTQEALTLFQSEALKRSANQGEWLPDITLLLNHLTWLYADTNEPDAPRKGASNQSQPPPRTDCVIC
jgi:ankyrin repeat protein